MYKFLRSLRRKILIKNQKYPEFKLEVKKLLNSKTFKEFDGLYTAPVSGFSGPEDYWEKASSRPYLSSIKKPVLLITSKDDPFLAKACYPFIEAEKSNYFYLEVTNHGGHVGFISSFLTKKNRWLENRIIEFIKDNG